MAPGVGFEPTTKGLTVLCATAALPRNAAKYYLFIRMPSINMLVKGFIVKKKRTGRVGLSEEVAVWMRVTPA